MSDDCRNCQNLMSEFIDRELNPSDRREFERHLEQCPQCHREFKLFKLTCEAVQQIPSPPAPQDFLIKLRQKIARLPENRPVGVFSRATQWLMAHPVMIAASFVMVFGGAFALGRYAPTPVLAAKASEMEPMKGWEMPIDRTAADRFEAKVEGAHIAPAAFTAKSAVASNWESLALATAPDLSGPAEAAVTEPAPQLFLQTPTQLVINLLRTDPLFQGARIYPIRQGAVVQTDTAVYRIIISDQNFITALKLAVEKKSLPRTIAEAQKLYGLEVEQLPNPLKP